MAEMSDAEAATMFRALSDPTRLKIFRFLAACSGAVSVDDNGDVRRADGPTAGEVCCHVTGESQINSRVSQHLKELRLAGLIHTEKRGKFSVFAANTEAVTQLTEFLTCCCDAAEPAKPESCC